MSNTDTTTYYTNECTTAAWNSLFKNWTPISTREDSGIADSVEEARKMLVNWLRANVSDEGDYDIESLCAQAMTLDVGDEMCVWESDGFAHNYTFRIAKHSL